MESRCINGIIIVSIFLEFHLVYTEEEKYPHPKGSEDKPTCLNHQHSMVRNTDSDTSTLKDQESFPRVTTPLGTVEGYYKRSSEGRPIEAYEGIPFAHPPTGERRFGVARSMSPWSGILMAKKYSASCVQVKRVKIMALSYEVVGSEDCLYLNVYIPVVDEREESKESARLLLPVIFFIHGGNFQFGSAAQYGPKYLMNKNVVLVTINYRVGPLGFLSTEDDTVPGNMGLKDQVIAMRWVRENIRCFGGDPDKVTLIGHSTGATTVHYHYMTNATAELFQRGMSIGGTALNPWSLNKNPLEKAKMLATIVKCPSSDISDMVECLRNRSADEITLASTKLMPWLDNPMAPFGAVVEKGRSEITIVDRPPIDAIISGRVLKKPWITAVVSEEGLIRSSEFMSNATLLEELNDNWEEIAPHLLDYNYTIPESEKKNISWLIRQHFLGTNPIDNSTIKQIIRMLSGRLFLYDAEKAARLQARATQNPVRFYYFSYRGAFSFSESFTGAGVNYGVSHVDDLLYVMESFFDASTTQQDREMQKVMTNLWVSYATDGIPDVGVEWPELDPDLDEFRYLHIAGPDNIYVDGDANFGDKDFWSSIPFEENIPQKNIAGY